MPDHRRGIATAQKSQTLSLPGQWETIGALGGSLDELVTFRLPENYFTMSPDKARVVTVNDLTKAAQKKVHPDQLVWGAVRERSKIAAPMRKLGWGEIKLLDADSNVVK